MNKKNPIKIIIDIITYSLIIIIGIYLVLSIYNKYITKNQATLIGKYYLFQIATGSMEHELVPGDYIIVEKTTDFKVGDIVTYIEDGYYITHRISEINETSITTKGDANTTIDKPISKDKIIGKYIYKERILTFISRYRVLVIATLVALIIIDNVIYKKPEKEEVKEVEE